MAFDTEQARKSIVTIGAYFVGPTVVVDGAFSKLDRQQIGYGYAGFEVSYLNQVANFKFSSSAPSILFTARQ